MAERFLECADAGDRDVVLPVVAEVVVVAEDVVGELRDVGEKGGFGERVAVPVGELVEVEVLPAHRDLNDLVEEVEADPAGDFDAAGDLGSRALEDDL